MSALFIDTDIQDQISDMMHSAVVNAEEAQATLRTAKMQMECEAGELTLYGEWGNALADCASALSKASVLVERLQQLQIVLSGISSEYSELENKHVQSLEKLSGKSVGIGAAIAGITAASYPVGLEEGENKSNAKALEQSLSNVVLGLDVANLSAVSKVIDDDYGVDSVKPVVPTNIYGTNPVILHEEDSDSSKTGSKAKK